MKRIFTVLLFLIAFNSLRAQAPNWLWAVSSLSGGFYEDGGGLGFDGVSNLYMTGRFDGTLSIGGQTATDGNGGTIAYNAKFDKNGNFQWITPQYYQSGNDYVMGYGRDKDNNTYCIGSAESSHELILTKVNSAGEVVWADEIPSTTGIFEGDPTGLGVAIGGGDSENVYITGELRGSMTFGSTTITEATGTDIYVAKFDSAGNSQWAVAFGDANFNEANSIQLDKAGNIYLCGNYSGTPSYGSFTAPPAVNGSNFFIAKLNSSAGAVEWMATATSAGMPDGAWWPIQGMAIDSCGNLYVTGSFEGTAQFGSLPVTSNGSDDIFVAKCMNDGQWAWVKSAGGSGSDRGAGITLDKNFDIYIVGDYQNTAQFATQSITATANQDVFAAKYANSTGDLQWVQTIAGTPGQNNGATGIAVDDQKFSYITGTYNSAANFGSHAISAGGANIVFVAKLDTLPNLQIAVTPSASYCPGSSGQLTFTTTGTFNSGNNFTAEISDSSGNFITPTTIGVNTGATSGGSIPITIPAGTIPGSNYIIRIVSSSPAYSSFDYCFRVSIGGGLSTSVSPADTTACSSSPVQLQAMGGSSYSWLPAVGLTCYTCANPVATPALNTTYTVSITSGSCPPVVDSLVINIKPSTPMVATPHDTSVCSGNAVALNSTGGSGFLWSPGLSLTDSTIANPVATPTISTTYIVSGGACSTPAQVIVNVGNVALGGTVTASRDTICQGTPGNLSLAGNSSNILQWQSSTDSIHYINDLNDTLASYKTTPLQQTTWYHVIVGTGNCTALSDSLKLYVPPALTASFYFTQTSGNTLTFNSDSSSGNIRSYHWDFGDGQTSDEQNPQHTYATDSTYYVCLTLYDGSNCSYTFCRYSLIDGISTISAAGNWVIFPNPFENQLAIGSGQWAAGKQIQSIEMYDVLGRIVVNEVVRGLSNTSLQLDVSSLAKGMYYVMIRTADADYVQKVVKQ